MANLFPNLLPPETSIEVSKLPSNKELGPVEPDCDFCRNVEENGVFNPICLKETKPKGTYRVVEGRRRLKAARKANQKYIPARIFPLEWLDEEITQLGLHELRKPNPISELEAFEGALSKGWGIDEIKRRTGMKQARVRVLSQLQNLIPQLRAAMSDGRMKPSVAYLAAKLSVKDQKKLLPVLEETGRIKVRDIQEIRAARKSETTGDLPDSLFEDDGDWQVVALAKVGDLRVTLEAQKDEGLLAALDYLEEKIKES